MATLIAANSDSTLMNSQRRARRLHHFAQPFDDVRLRRDRVGADHLGAAQRDRRRNGEEAADSESGRQLIQAEFARREGRVDECVAVRLEAGEDVDLVQQGRVLHHEGVGSHDGLPDADLLVGDATERDDRGSGALGTETGEGLGMATFIECGNGQQLGGSDHALSASAVDADLEHALNVCRGSR
jgi:hypothetical protein